MARLPQYRRQEIQSAMVSPVADNSSAVAAQAVQQATSSMMATAANIGQNQQKRTNAAAAASFQNIGYELAWQQQQKRQMEAHQQAVVNEAMLSHHYDSIQRLAVDKLTELRTTMAATPTEVTKAFDDWYSKEVPDMISKNADLKSRSPDVATRLMAKVDSLRTNYYEANKSWGLSKDTENLVNLTKADDEMMAAEARNMTSVQDLNMLMARRQEREPARIVAFGEGVAKSTGKALDEEIVTNFVESLTRSDPDQAQAFLDGGNFKEYIKNEDALRSNVRSAQTRIEQQAEEADIKQNMPNYFTVSKIDASVDRYEPLNDKDLDTAKTQLREMLYNAEKLPQTKQNLLYYNKVKDTLQGLESLERVADSDERRIENERQAKLREIDRREAKLRADENFLYTQQTREALNKLKEEKKNLVTPESLDRRVEYIKARDKVLNSTTNKKTSASTLEIQKALDLGNRNLNAGLSGMPGDTKEGYVQDRAALEAIQERINNPKQDMFGGFLRSQKEIYFTQLIEPAPLDVVNARPNDDLDTVNADYRQYLNRAVNAFLQDKKGQPYRQEPWTMPPAWLEEAKRQAAQRTKGLKVK